MTIIRIISLLMFFGAFGPLFYMVGEDRFSGEVIAHWSLWQDKNVAPDEFALSQEFILEPTGNPYRLWLRIDERGIGRVFGATAVIQLQTKSGKVLHTLRKKFSQHSDREHLQLGGRGYSRWLLGDFDLKLPGRYHFAIRFEDKVVDLLHSTQESWAVEIRRGAVQANKRLAYILIPIGILGGLGAALTHPANRRRFGWV